MYIGYHIKKSNRSRLKKYVSFIHEQTGKDKLFIVSDMVACSLLMGTSFYEYFYYSFVSKGGTERKAYASMGFMYEYQKRNNPVSARLILQDKLKYYMAYPEFVGRSWLELRKTTVEQFAQFVKDKEKVVIKGSTSGAGQKVKVLTLRDVDLSQLMNYAVSNGFDIVEEFVCQHEDMMKLAPNSLNTIRVITQINRQNNGIDIIGAILRLGIFENTDNLTTGGIAAKVDIDSGIVIGNGISFDITTPDYEVHPVSNIRIEGFKLPYWQESLEMCRKAALLHPENRSVGWDVAIKEEGPILIEGNHDWGARLWQMPERCGMKAVLLKYL